MTIRHLQIYKAVCDYGSATVAAEKLNISQPAVSIAIRELETFYGVKLFERTGRSLRLTEAGQMLNTLADNVIARFNETTEIMRDGTNFATIRLGANTSAGETRLPQLIDEVKEKLPQIKLTCLVNNTESIMEKLVKNNIDFAIVNEFVDDDQLVRIPLYREEIKVYCSSDLYQEEEITFEQLIQMPFLLRERGSFVRETIYNTAKKYSLHLKPIVESTSTLSLISLARRGMGFVFLPYRLEKMFDLSGLHSVKVDDESFASDYYLYYHKNKYFTTTMDAFLTHLSNN